jgi:hypothetical protein
MEAMSFNAAVTKSQLVDQILAFNASAPREWFESFEFGALEGYLRRLREAVARRTGGGPSGALPFTPAA